MLRSIRFFRSVIAAAAIGSLLAVPAAGASAQSLSLLEPLSPQPICATPLCFAHQVVVNGGFENTMPDWPAAPANWYTYGSSGSEPPVTSSFHGCGNNSLAFTPVQRQLFQWAQQGINIPVGDTRPLLSFDLNIQTRFAPTSPAADHLFVDILDAKGYTLGTVATYTNRDATSAIGANTWSHKGNFDLSLPPFNIRGGQSITLRFDAWYGTLSGPGTTFFLDNVQIWDNIPSPFLSPLAC
jgi:hypothetical protein